MARKSVKARCKPKQQKPILAVDRLVTHSLQSLTDANLERYWHQRYRLFAKFDDGVWMDAECWYSATPEPIAKFIAEHFASIFLPGTTIIDVFCGSGSNSIHFAKYFDKVITIDNDPVKLACARHNAAIYGVDDKITFIESSADNWLQNPTIEIVPCAVFMSPPWGGPKYRDQESFDLSAMQPFNFQQLYNLSIQITPDIGLYLPKTSDLEQLTQVYDEKCLVTFLYTSNKCKALCAFYGQLKKV